MKLTKELIEKIKADPDKWIISVDNDSMSIYEDKEDGEYFSIDMLPVDIVIWLFDYIGLNAEQC